MKLVSLSQNGKTHIGALVANGVLDLNRAQPGLPTDMVALLEAGHEASSLIQRALASPDERFVVPASAVNWRAPVPKPGKIICIGHNYYGHSGATAPTYPDVFAKFANVVIGHQEPIVIPEMANQVDYEAELAVVIGKRARRVAQDHALEHVAGYTVFNDVSARDVQKRSSQWTLGKGFDTFGPMGPVLVTADEIGDPGNLELTLAVNGEERQHSNTCNLIFSIPYLIAYLSAVMTLEPGDIISTGTPGGTGASHKPPVFLKPGDVTRIWIDRIGELINPVVIANT